MSDDDRPQRPQISYIGPVSDPMDKSIEDISDSQALGGSCRVCEREGWLDRIELRRKWGNAILASLQPRLRCLECGNKTGNKWIIGKRSQ